MSDSTGGGMEEGCVAMETVLASLELMQHFKPNKICNLTLKTNTDSAQKKDTPTHTLNKIVLIFGEMCFYEVENCDTISMCAH